MITSSTEIQPPLRFHITSVHKYFFIYCWLKKNQFSMLYFLKGIKIVFFMLVADVYTLLGNKDLSSTLSLNLNLIFFSKVCFSYLTRTKSKISLLYNFVSPTAIFAVQNVPYIFFALS